MRLFLGRSKSSTIAAAPLQASPIGKSVLAKKSAVGDVERKAEEPIGSGVTALRLEPSPEYITTTHEILTALETYSLYHCTAGRLFLVGCAVFYGVDRGDGLRFRNITATALLGIGLLHVCHGLNTLPRALP
ncbi:uncharacterized protein LOC142776991 [Rhipicephalus microplus]|uniref:uncharacterized protein LOC142776991 n=1 Tax=Rhipicephalus microplus TaxID=6941 RepID=UPI003F6A7B48